MDSDDDEVTQSSYIPSAADLEIMRRPTHDLDSGIATHRVCRKIYYEAVETERKSTARREQACYV
jgi:hypothetical protein